MATVKQSACLELAPRVETTSGGARSAPPRMLRCLVVSNDAARRRLIRSAAERQAWDAIVCRDAGEFLRTAFKRSVPLMVIDLPSESSPDYLAIRDAASHAKQISNSLVVIAGATQSEEKWARQLGAWSYLSEGFGQRGFEFLFCEARAALERTEVDSSDVLACFANE